MQITETKGVVPRKDWWNGMDLNHQDVDHTSTDLLVRRVYLSPPFHIYCLIKEPNSAICCLTQLLLPYILPHAATPGLPRCLTYIKIYVSWLLVCSFSPTGNHFSAFYLDAPNISRPSTSSACGLLAPMVVYFRCVSFTSLTVLPFARFILRLSKTCNT